MPERFREPIKDPKLQQLRDKWGVDISFMIAMGKNPDIFINLINELIDDNQDIPGGYPPEFSEALKSDMKDILERIKCEFGDEINDPREGF